jgi:hypothetical protein
MGVPLPPEFSMILSGHQSRLRAELNGSKETWQASLSGEASQ